MKDEVRTLRGLETPANSFGSSWTKVFVGLAMLTLHSRPGHKEHFGHCPPKPSGSLIYVHLFRTYPKSGYEKRNHRYTQMNTDGYSCFCPG
jgi:hypothetical protein